MIYYAHLSDNGDRQTVDEHLQNVAGLTKMYSSKFGAEQMGYLCGILHDVGKYSMEFQNRLSGQKIKVDHSTAGAIEARKLFIDRFGQKFGEFFSKIPAYIICGHHSGLMDFGSLESGLKSRFCKEIPVYDYDIKDKNIDISNIRKELPKKVYGRGGFTIGFFIRMLYSCLVDADFLDTEKFMGVDRYKLMGEFENFSSLTYKFNAYMDAKNENSVKNKINGYRQQILKYCIEAAYQRPNFFTLTIPTGGGKTLASMAFALNHLKYNNLQRIICVIPYTSIIEQNAKQYKDIFGEESVLEHHSNFDFDKNDSTADKLKYASENWDIPIVVTTNVQFFESLFANKSSKCRKLHNISNSVVIIDEAQMIPTNFLKPTLAAIGELVNNYNTSVVLSTATKPEFPGNIMPMKPVEIISEPEVLYNALKRVEVKYIKDQSDFELAKMIDNLSQVLVIVNTRNHAQKLYELLPKDNLFHLSAKMCPAHRSEVIHKIKARLKAHEPCRVISTQLIECGVDISFPVVYRSLAGIDSIVQSAGRCNREGEMNIGKVYVFNSTEKYGTPILYQSRTAECGRMILEKYKDPLSQDAISEYFRILYDIEKERLDEKKIMDNFEEGAEKLVFSFEKTARDYKLIEETESLIIPYNDKASGIIESLEYSEYPSSLVRKLQSYTISIHKFQLKKLMDEGAVNTVDGRFHILACKEGFYDENTGLVLDNNETLIF